MTHPLKAGSTGVMPRATIRVTICFCRTHCLPRSPSAQAHTMKACGARSPIQSMLNCCPHDPCKLPNLFQERYPGPVKYAWISSWDIPKSR